MALVHVPAGSSMDVAQCHYETFFYDRRRFYNFVFSWHSFIYRVNSFDVFVHLHPLETLDTLFEGASEDGPGVIICTIYNEADYAIHIHHY